MQLLRLGPEATAWTQATPLGLRKSPYAAMGRHMRFQTQIPHPDLVWFEGVYYSKTPIVLGAGLFFTRKNAPMQIHLCLGVLHHPGTKSTWTVVATESKLRRPLHHFDSHVRVNREMGQLQQLG
jgi:hypothetical protein